MSPFTIIRAFLSLGKSVSVGLSRSAEERNPVDLFREWYSEAEKTGMLLPEAMTLATATKEGSPKARLVLLKAFDESGFTFYTNYDSDKGMELAENPRAALVFHWSPLQRQVRIEGAVERLDWEESNRYFQSRARGSRIGAWASLQSRPLSSRSELEQRVKEVEKRYKGGEVPLPDSWGGFRVIPDRFEFWQGRLHRLHDRLRFTRSNSEWNSMWLYP